MCWSDYDKPEVRYNEYYKKKLFLDINLGPKLFTNNKKDCENTGQREPNISKLKFSLVRPDWQMTLLM